MKPVFCALLLAAASLFAVAAPQVQPGPSSKDRILELVRAGVPADIVAETVLHYWISFEPTEAVLSEFRQAGAADVILKAMHESWSWESKGPLNDKDIRELLAEHLPNGRVFSLIEQRRIGFEPSEEYLQGLRSSGVKDDIIDALRACAKRPFSRDYLLQLLASREDPSQIAKLVEEHGIDFVPSEDSLAGLRSAGASESLLQTVREAKQYNDAHALCPPAAPSLPVFPSLDDTNTILARLACGDRVIIEHKDSGRIGLVKVLLGDGREGFVQGSHLVPSDPRGSITPPRPTYKPEPLYTPQARHSWWCSRPIPRDRHDHVSALLTERGTC